jgi:serine/threonine-protein kinase RsbW
MLLTLEANLAGLAQLQTDAAAFLKAAGASEQTCFNVLLALDEVAGNIVMHAGTPLAQPIIDVRLSHTADTITADIIDTGPPFDPTVPPAPAPSASDDPLSALSIGGRGLLLAHAVSQHMAYVREGNRNRLTIRFARQAAPDATPAT